MSTSLVVDTSQKWDLSTLLETLWLNHLEHEPCSLNNGLDKSHFRSGFRFRYAYAQASTFTLAHSAF